MNVFQLCIICKRTHNSNNATYYVKLGKKRRESSKRNYYIISPRAIIKAMIIMIHGTTKGDGETWETWWDGLRLVVYYLLRRLRSDIAGEMLSKMLRESTRIPCVAQMSCCSAQEPKKQTGNFQAHATRFPRTSRRKPSDVGSYLRSQDTACRSICFSNYCRFLANDGDSNFYCPMTLDDYRSNFCARRNSPAGHQECVGDRTTNVAASIVDSKNCIATFVSTLRSPCTTMDDSSDSSRNDHILGDSSGFKQVFGLTIWIC